MENKEYFVPDIEDLFVGYELQLMNIENAQWGKYVIKEEDSFKDFIEDIDSECLRVPYLTKEDIESLGWKYSYSITPDSSREFKGQLVFELSTQFVNYKLNFDRRVSISGWYHEDSNNPSTTTLFRGFCLSINELKKLMKMLNIPINEK